MKEKILAREKACFDFLNSIPANRKFVLVGGYAVSSFEFPRLSVDLDIAIPESELKFFRELLKESGFILSHEKGEFDLTYGGKFEKYIKKEPPISVDLLINSVQSRQTNYAYSYAYIEKNSETREIRGWHPELKAKIRVANKEMLLALKINSMRTADKRDVIMLCYEMPQTDALAKHLKNCPKDAIAKNLSELSVLLSDKKIRDAIKGAFTISDGVLERAIKNCREVVSKLKDAGIL
jgi:hypothetical protein